jgi:DNA modification methylase
MAEPKVTRRKLSEYTPDPNNANQGTERGQYMIDYSIGSVGSGRSLVAAANDVLPIGNHAQQAFVDAGYTDVIEVETDGDVVVVHKRRDWASADDPIAKKAALLDNRTSEVGLQWDPAVLAALQAENAALLEGLWRDDELAELMVTQSEAAAGDDPGAQTDRAAELQEQWQTARGQIWEVPSMTMEGRTHRIMCGDSTSADDVARLMGRECYRLIWTDPPYGVNNEAGEQRRLEYGRPNDRASSHIENDSLKPAALASLLLKAFTNAHEFALQAAAFYSAVPPGPLYTVFVDAWERAGFTYKRQLVWVKNHFVMGGGDYHYRHEPILYGWIENGAHYFINDRTKDTVLEFDKPYNSDMHPTMKPVELVLECICNSSMPNDIVYDPFAGSGSTIVAAEQCGRIGYALEISPSYAAVCLERLAGMGLVPRLSEENRLSAAAP